MKILKYILFGILAVVVIFLIIAAVAPKHIKVERTTTVNAPKPVVYEHIRTLRNMQAWSPWVERDPNMKMVYSGNDGEIGSSYTWEGNDEVGSGKQTLTSVSENRVEGELVFREPFESKAHNYAQVDEVQGGSKVTWGFEQDMAYPWNGMCVFMDMDAMIGKDFEKGLSKLKALAESTPVNKTTSYEVQEVDREAQTYIGKRATVKFNDIGAFYGQHFPAIMQAAGKANVQPSGSPSGVYYKWDEKAMTADLAASIPVSNPKAKVAGYETIHVPAGKALKVAYYGAYDKSMDAHMAIDKYMNEKGLKNANVIEEYVTDPSTEKDTAKWLTNIYYMVSPK